MKVYLDYAASTPLDRSVRRSMFFWLRRNYGNASALHFFGQRIKNDLTSSRQTIADYLNCSVDSIVFTASATEANNLVIKGCWRRLGAPLGNIIISAIEHKSVALTARELEKSGVEVRVLPVKSDGTIDLDKLHKLLDEKTFLVSIMYVNNETGIIQPLKEAVKIVANYNKEHRQKIYFHTDAVQALGYLPCQPNELGVDFLTFSGHKIYGPQGIGCLYVKKRESLEPLIVGGGQEYGLRSGTENMAAVVGLAIAVELLPVKKIKQERAEFIYSFLSKKIPRIVFNSSPKLSVPGIINFRIPGIKAQDMLIALSTKGIAMSSGSACQAGAQQASTVLKAMSLNEEEAKESMRLSWGRGISRFELKYALESIVRVSRNF